MHIGGVSGDLNITTIDSDVSAGATLDSTTPLKLLRSLALRSKISANRLYERSGLYLLFGVLIAFSGLTFFYLQSSAIGTQPHDFSAAILEMLPRFGVLFFIEFIAFFFLRQYRAAMDEYRHFEAIQRQREDNLAVVTLVNDSDLHFDDRLRLVEATALNRPIGVIPSGATSETIETRKLTRDELAIFEKLLDVLSGKK